MEKIDAAAVAAIERRPFDRKPVQIDIDLAAGIGGVPIDVRSQIVRDLVGEASESLRRKAAGRIDPRDHLVQIPLGHENTRMLCRASIGAGERRVSRSLAAKHRRLRKLQLARSR
jgi:hypothetical protein